MVVTHLAMSDVKRDRPLSNNLVTFNERTGRKVHRITFLSLDFRFLQLASINIYNIFGLDQWYVLEMYLNCVKKNMDLRSLMPSTTETNALKAFNQIEQ